MDQSTAGEAVARVVRDLATAPVPGPSLTVTIAAIDERGADDLIGTLAVVTPMLSWTRGVLDQDAETFAVEVADLIQDYVCDTAWRPWPELADGRVLDPRVEVTTGGAPRAVWAHQGRAVCAIGELARAVG